MDIFGEIKVILSEKVVILSSTNLLHANERVVVFAAISGPKLSDLGFSDPLYIPIGELQVVSRIAVNTFMAKVFREEKEVTRKIYSNPPFFAGHSWGIPTITTRGKRSKGDCKKRMVGGVK